MSKQNNEPKSWLSSTENTFGQEMENKFITALGKLGVPEVPRVLKDEDVRQKKGFAIARGTAEEDTNGIDFWLYLPKYKNWFAIDLTTTNNPDKLSAKKMKERNTGIRVLRLDVTTLDLASKGGEMYLEKISQAIGSLFRED